MLNVDVPNKVYRDIFSVKAKKPFNAKASIVLRDWNQKVVRIKKCFENFRRKRRKEKSGDATWESINYLINFHS